MVSKKELTEEMAFQLSKYAYDNWSVDTIIDELAWAYRELAYHDRSINETLIDTYKNLPKEEEDD